MTILANLVKGPLKRLRAIAYYGKARFCPVCGKSARKFRSAGEPPRPDAQCPHCSSFERHRFLWLYLARETDLFDGQTKRMLHIAPEGCLEPRFRMRLGENYVTADLNRKAMLKMDITNIQFPDQSVDVIYCSHVLEHVQNDRKAMREFCRVLKTDGWAILLVPVWAEKTFEDPSVDKPQDRLRLFGQIDHVRKYGRDYVDRLRESGFSVSVTKVHDMLPESEAVRMGLTSAAGEIYYCTRNTHR